MGIEVEQSVNPLTPSGLKSKRWREENRERFNEYQRNYYHKRKSDRGWLEGRLQNGAHSRRKAKYGITRAEFEARVNKQEGRCAICEAEKGDKLRVDHDHETGEVRALLCANCNAGLGFLNDDPAQLRKAAKYLQAHSKKVR